MGLPSFPPVKECPDARPCRYCGRPTWSLRRRCVPCKRAGRWGRELYPSIDLDAPRAGRLVAALGLWLVVPGAAAAYVALGMKPDELSIPGVGDVPVSLLLLVLGWLAVAVRRAGRAGDP